MEFKLRSSTITLYNDNYKNIKIPNESIHTKYLIAPSVVLERSTMEAT